MEWFRRNPAVIPAIGLLVGAALAPQLDWLPLPLVVLLLAASTALGGRPGVGFGALAMGFWLGLAGDPGELPAGFDGGRPVRVEGRLLGPVHCATEPGEVEERGRGKKPTERSSARLRAEVLSQGSPGGRWIASTPFELVLTAAGCDPRWIPGSRWRVHGLLRRSTGFRNEPVVPPGPWRLVVVSDRLSEQVAPASSLARWIDHARRRALVEIDPATGPRLLAPLLLGARGGLDDSLEVALRRAGLAHLLAVSGLHVAVLAGLAWIVASPLPRRGRLLSVGLVVAGYLLLLGPRPSILRSAAMALVALLALLLERPPQPANSLAVVVLVLVVSDPARVLEVGFQLSVAATAGIVVLVPPLGRRLPFPPIWGKALAVPLAAQLATLPWTVAWSGGIHPAATGLDLVAMPWLAVYLASGLVALSSALVGGPDLLGWVADLDRPVEWLADLPASSWWFLPLRVDPWLGAALWLVCVGLLVVEGCRDGRVPDPEEGLRDRSGDGARSAKAPRWRLGCVMLVAVVSSGARAPQPPPPEVRFFDVGQGDATLLVGGGEAILVDGGGWWRGDFGGRVLVPALVRAGVSRLRAVVLSHPDRDHCRGLVDVSRWLPVDEVWSSPGWNEPCARELVGLPGARWRPLWAGDRRRVGPWHLEVLHPVAGDRSVGNDRSLVLRATVDGRGVLLSGDVEARAERELMRRHGDRLATVLLKVAHHGSKTSTGGRWIDVTQPQVAVVSAGRNNLYGHPNGDVLRRLDRRAVITLRTDRDGLVRWVFPRRSPSAPR